MANEVQSLVQTYYKAFNAKKYEDMLSLLTDDVVHDTNQGSRTQGKDAFRDFLKDMDRYYDEQLEDIVVMADSTGRRAAAEFTCLGTYKSSAEGLPAAKGQKYRLPVGCFFDIRSGKIARVTNYYNLNDWLKQVQG